MGAVDDVLATLRAELDREKVLMTISLNRSEAIHAAIEALEGLGGAHGRLLPKAPREPVAKRPVGAPPKRAAGGATTKPKVARSGGSGRRVAAMQKAAKERVNCPECGKEVSKLGIGVHRSRAHPASFVKAEPFTREPITKMPVDEQKIRDAQAGPSMGKVNGLTGVRGTPRDQPIDIAPSRPQFTPEMADAAIAAAS